MATFKVTVKRTHKIEAKSLGDAIEYAELAIVNLDEGESYSVVEV